jgi:DNA-damage-inducible protein D
MGDSQQDKQGFELIPIPQEAIGPEENEEIFEVRRVWHKEDQIWYYSVIDFVKVLTRSKNPNVYWSALKKRNQQDQGFVDILEKIKELPLRGKDGRLRGAEFVTREVMLRLVQSIPSERAERVRLWLAQVGEEKLQEIKRGKI